VNAAGGTAVDDTYSAVGILAREVYPARPHPVDAQAQLTRLLKQKRDERNEFSAKKNILKSNRSISDEDIRQLARDFVDNRIRIDSEIYRRIDGFNKIEKYGVSLPQVANIMRERDMGYGPRRTSLIFNKLAERPVIDPAFAEDVLKLGEVGANRLRVFQSELNKYERFIPLNVD
jgi:hypothetical protein